MSSSKYQKVTFFLIFLILLIGSIIYAGPSAIFYFDQKEGFAIITGITKEKVAFKYYHEELAKEISLVTKVTDLKQIKTLSTNEKVKIIYSSNFPRLVAILKIHGKIGMQGLILISIFALPLILFNRIDFDHPK